MQFNMPTRKPPLKKSLLKNKKPFILDDDDVKHIKLNKDDTLKKSKIVFETRSNTESSSDLNVASATTNKFLSYDHSFSRNYEINASLVKKDDNLFVLTSAHHNVKKSIVNPITQYTYKNFEPLYDFDFGSTEMLLTIDEKDKDFVENVYPHGIGIGSDVWGFVNKTFDGERLIEEYYSLVTTEKGMVIYKMDGDSRVTSGKHFCYPLQFISGSTENTWGDAKTYDVTSMTLNFKEIKASKKIMRNSLIKFIIVKRIYNGETIVLQYPVIVYGKVLEVLNDNKSNSELSMDNMHPHLMSHDNNNESVDIHVRIKTDFNWQHGDHCHNIMLVNNDALDEKPYSLPEDITAHVTIKNPERKLSCYFTKESKGRLLAIDLKPLLVNQKAVVTYDYFDDSKKPFKLEDNKIVEIGATTGSHDVYVNEEQGILYNVGMQVLLDNGDTISTGVCYDLKENHLQPVPKSIILDFPVNYLHDIIVESYNRSEQHALLGIPMNKTKELMFIAIGSTGADYALYDVTNLNKIEKISSWLIEGGGYYHQVWFTSDKRYMVISDEHQPDDVRYINRVPILRLYYDINNERLQLYHVQDIQNPFPTRNHNQYIVNNIDLFGKNNNEFEDWVFGSNYNSGIQAEKISYKKFDKNNFESEFDYEIRQKPFDLEFMGFIDTEVGSSDYSFGGSWSVYPFWELEKTAEQIKYLSSGDHSMTIFKFKNGVENLLQFDLHNDGRVQKCHPTQVMPKGAKYSMKYDEARPNKSMRSTRIDGINETAKLSKKDGTYENVVLTPVGYSEKLDVQIYYVAISNSHIDEFIYLECADKVNNDDLIYAYCGNHKCEGKVIKNMATDHYRVDKGQGLDPTGYAQYYEITPNNIILYPSRVGEIITNLPARLGDSGNPVVNKNNEFVGFINSVDVTGGNSGIVNVCDGINNFLKPMDIPSKTTNINGIEGIYNNRINQITNDDPSKLSVVAINERTGKMYFYISSSLSKYFMMDLLQSGYTSNENGFYKEVTGNNYASGLFNMNETNYYTRSFLGGEFLFNVYTILIKSKEKTNFLFAEECFGEYKNRGPRVIFIGYDEPKKYEENFTEYNEETGYYYCYIKVYLVSENNDNIDKLFTDDQFINPLGLVSGHIPKNDDKMKSEESEMEFMVVNNFVSEEQSKPSWYYDRRISYSASVYPFSDGVPSLFPYFKRSSNALTNVNEYSGLTKEKPLKLTGFGESRIDQLKTSGINIQIYQNKTIDHESRVTFSQGWNAVNSSLNIPYELGVSVTSLDGKNVNSDNFEYILHTIPYEENKKVIIGTNTGDFEIPLVRYKNNSHGII
uniref:Uncharacterized protein n=1 Tax=viral metagenome TaxID=1070528 RepID=A0A6C0EHX4_9ZZZZ